MFGGRVLDGHTGQPVGGVVLSCLGAGRVHYSRSDDGGRFCFANVEGGNWQIWASKPPYTDHSSNHWITPEGEVHIYLRVEGLEDEAVTA